MRASSPGRRRPAVLDGCTRPRYSSRQRRLSVVRVLLISLLLCACRATGDSQTRPPTPPDGDGDGAADDRDRCPDRPGVAPDGCPPPDGDGDGILDPVDTCPDRPGVAPDGCPVPDTDGDGLLDPDDRCPDQPETRNGYQDEDGCTDELPGPKPEFFGTLPGVTFARGKATIAADQTAKLDGTVAALNQISGFRLEISGHTDDREKSPAELSLRRAEAVREYLQGRGIAAERLVVRGAGASEPADDNKTSAGRARNRRVEFKALIIESSTATQ